MERSVLFLDNGGYTVKAMFIAQVGQSQPRYLTIPNAVGAAPHAGRGLVGASIQQLPHYHSFLTRRPTDRGYVVDIPLQAHVWEYVLGHFSIESEEAVDLYLTVPFGSPKAAAQVLFALFTEHFSFRSVTFVSSTFLALLASEGGSLSSDSGTRKRPREGEPGAADGCGIVVDVGFSGTTVVPYVHYLPVCSSIARTDVGGKLLANYLKELISFRQVDVMQDGWLVQHIMQRCCAVTRAPRALLAFWQKKAADDNPLQRAAAAAAAASATAEGEGENEEEGEGDAGDESESQSAGASEDVRSGSSSSLASPQAPPSLLQETDEVLYYLPSVVSLMPLGCTGTELDARLSGAESSTGFRRTLQKITLRHERFMVPELLFSPMDAGIHQLGVAECITSAIFRRGLLREVPLLRPALLARVHLMGGLSRTPGFRDRLNDELRKESLGERGCFQLVGAAPAGQQQKSAEEVVEETTRGALLLLTSSAQADRLALVEKRCKVLLATNKMVTVEDIQKALASLL